MNRDRYSDLIEARRGGRRLEFRTRDGCNSAVHNVAEEAAKVRVHLVGLRTSVGS
jgi:hypothetical protein